MYYNSFNLFSDSLFIPANYIQDKHQLQSQLTKLLCYYNSIIPVNRLPTV